MSFYKEFFTNNADFTYEDGLFYQKNFLRNNAFELSYLTLRKKEGRVYTDDVVRLLPEFTGIETLSKEWKIRKRSTKRLIHYLKHKQPASIIEIGCGNGWLIQHLHRYVKAEYCGVDINEPELQQATRTSGNTHTYFLYGDILSDTLSSLRADTIIVASAAQYFPHLESFIKHLLRFIPTHGEIHIIDTPFYDEEQIEIARRSSDKYFTDAGIDAKQRYYFHHSWKSLEALNYKIIYHPKSIFNKIKNTLIADSPFPWIVIKKDSNNE